MDKEKDPTEINKVDSTKHAEVVQELERTREAHQNLQGKFTDMQKQIEKFENVDLEKLMANNEAYQRMLDKKAEESGDEESFKERLEAKLSEVRAENQSALEKLESTAKTYKQKYEELAITDSVMAKLAPEILDSEDVHVFFKQMVRQEFGIDDNGELFVKDKEGAPLYKDGTNVKLSVDEWVKAKIEKFPSLAKSKNKNGTRQPGENRGDVVNKRTLTPPASIMNNKAALTEWYKQNRGDAKAPSLA